MALPFQTLTFNNLRGEKTNRAKTQKAPFDAEVALSGYFDEKGSFERRKGGSIYRRLSNRIYGGYDFRYDSSQSILIYSGTELYENDSGAAIQTGLTAAVPDFTEYAVSSSLFSSDKKFCFVVNGSDTPLKYDGTTVTNLGIARPSAAPSGAGASLGGSLTATGVYLVRYTFVSADGVESNPSDQLSVTLGGGDDAIQLTNVPVSSDSQVTARYIYMSTNGGATLTYNTQIADNTSTTVNITAESAGSGLEYYHDAPPVLEGIEAWNDRLVGFKGNTFYWSDRYRPFYWPQGDRDANFESDFDYTLEVENEIKSVRAFYDAVLIFTEHDVYAFNGTSPLNFYIRKVKSDQRAGAINNRTSWVFDNWCYYVSTDGVYRTNGNVIQKVSAPLEDYFNLYSQAETYKINKANISEVHAVIDFEKETYIFWIPTGNSTLPDMAFTIHLASIALDDNNEVAPNVSPWPDYAATASFPVKVSGRNLYFRGTNDGDTFKEKQIDGDGAEITSTATSGSTTTITDTAQSWTVDNYKNLKVKIIDGTGAGQTSYVSSNTADTLTVSPAFGTAPDATSVYSLGWFTYAYEHSWNDYGAPTNSKRLRFIRPRFEVTSAGTITIKANFDFDQGDAIEFTVSLSSSSLWDVALWDADVWDDIQIEDDKISIGSSNIHRWGNIRIESERAGDPITYNGLDKIFQLKGVR